MKANVPNELVDCSLQKPDVAPLASVVRDPAPAHHRLRIRPARIRENCGRAGAFIHILHAVGAPAPSILGWATIYVEILGGFAVLAGAFIPLASIPMAIVLLSATFTVQLHNGFSSIKLISVDAAGAHFGQPGYETNILYLCGLVALVLGGSGPLSVEQLLFRLGSHSKNASNPKRVHKVIS
jgi:putative oxidoreductase